MTTGLEFQVKENFQRCFIGKLPFAARLLKDHRLAFLSAAEIFIDKLTATMKGIQDV